MERKNGASPLLLSVPPLSVLDPIQDQIQYWKTFMFESITITDEFSKVSKTSKNVWR